MQPALHSERPSERSSGDLERGALGRYVACYLIRIHLGTIGKSAHALEEEG